MTVLPLSVYADPAIIAHQVQYFSGIGELSHDTIFNIFIVLARAISFFSSATMPLILWQGANYKRKKYDRHNAKQ